MQSDEVHKMLEAFWDGFWHHFRGHLGSQIGPKAMPKLDAKPEAIWGWKKTEFLITSV